MKELSRKWQSTDLAHSLYFSRSSGDFVQSDQELQRPCGPSRRNKDVKVAIVLMRKVASSGGGQTVKMNDLSCEHVIHDSAPPGLAMS